VILHTIIFFVLLNEKRGINKHQGKYWTFNSSKGWMPYFPFFSEMTIYRSLKKLEAKGAVTTGRFNKRGYDKTKWYTVSNKIYNESKSSDYWKKHLAKVQNPSCRSARPIPDNNIINITPY